MKLVYLVLFDSKELEFECFDENYDILRCEYIKYMSSSRQDVFWFTFFNEDELLIDFKTINAIYCEDYDDDFLDDLNIDFENEVEETKEI